MPQETYDIPNKLFFKIREVAEITGLETHVLRFWESEFDFSVNKTDSKQRLYEKKDIEHIFLLKKLLYQDRFTIAGAKKKLSEIKKNKQVDLFEHKATISQNSNASSLSKKSPWKKKQDLKQKNEFILIKRQLNEIINDLKQF